MHFFVRDAVDPLAYEGNDDVLERFTEEAAK